MQKNSRIGISLITGLGVLGMIVLAGLFIFILGPLFKAGIVPLVGLVLLGGLLILVAGSALFFSVEGPKQKPPSRRRSRSRRAPLD